MRTYHLHETTTAMPAQFLAWLTDFGPGRQDIFGNSDDLDVDVVRDGKDLKGRVLALAVSTVGKRSLAKALDNAVKAVEARDYTDAPSSRKLAAA